MMRGRAGGVAALMLAVALGGCGGDDAPATKAADDTTSTSGGGAAALKAYCATIVALETTPEPDIDFDAMSPEQQTEEARKFAGQLVPLVEQARATVPAAITADVEVLADSIGMIARTGDFSAFDTPKVEAASDRAHAYELGHCGWKKVAVTAVDYAFQGISDSLPAGVTSFELANEGREPHEITVLRINDDVQLSAKEIVELPGEASGTKVEPVAHDFADPGGHGAALVDLKPGRYFAACFVPVDGREGGSSHASKGMVSAFEVK
ncbi:MAG TPA: hypothetical protein VMZ51_06255 [Acidimicrobiales bacterium]|nr:hypothetical protein [Acidimicrobiales bacterium]